MSEVIACANQKGGVGKTTTVVSLASYLALAGRNVLIVDLDPQGNATSGLGIDKGTVTASVYDALVGGMPMADLIQPSQLPGLSIAPSSRHLAAAEVELVPMAERERRLALALNPIADTYDYVILDCPPSLGLLTINALAAADTVLVPIQCEYYALEGLGALMGTINRVRDRINPSLALRGVVLTMFDGRTTLSSDVSREVHRHLGDQVFDVVVPRSVRLAEAPSYGRPIPLYSPASRGAQAYEQLAAEVMARGAQLRVTAGAHGAAAWVTGS